MCNDSEFVKINFKTPCSDISDHENMKSIVDENKTIEWINQSE